MSVTERPLQTPCEWCGDPVRQPSAGRLLRYCDRSCRQRAYEARTAARRLGADVGAGVVRTEPAERIVERVVRAKHPRTAAGWEQALDALRAQLADGRIGPWHAQRLQRAVALVDEQLQETAAGLATAGGASGRTPPAALGRQRAARRGDRTADRGSWRCPVDHARTPRRRPRSRRRRAAPSGARTGVHRFPRRPPASQRGVPAMRGHGFTPEEVDTVHRGIGRARAALDWMETAISTGRVDLDDSLARLLRGE